MRSFFLAYFYFLPLISAKNSKLVEIACSRNPILSFCGTESNQTTPETTKAVKKETVDLPTFEEALKREAKNLTLFSEVEKFDNISKTLEQNPDPKSLVVPPETLDEDFPAGNQSLNDTETDGIPDDPILEEPLPNNGSEFGSLLKLPNKKKTKTTTEMPSDLEVDLVTPPPLPRTIAPGVPEPSIKKAEVVEVFITKFCVDNRKNFIVKCRLEKVEQNDVEFCKSYPLKCQSNEAGVIPILAYCEQFIHDYVRVCAPTAKRNRRGKQFCKAYDQFCVPAPTPDDLLQASQHLVKCEEIVNQAKKICNPFPKPSDRLNHLRCTQFFKFCGKFVDWVRKYKTIIMKIR